MYWKKSVNSPVILTMSENLLEEKKSLELFLLVKLLEAELHLLVISGMVLGSQNELLLQGCGSQLSHTAR